MLTAVGLRRTLFRESADETIFEKGMSFGAKVAEERKGLGMSQKELALAVEISPQYLNDIEHGKRNPDSDVLIEKFAKALKLDSAVLYYLARRLPPGAVKEGIDDEKVVAAYAAFRRTLDKKK